MIECTSHIAEIAKLAFGSKNVFVSNRKQMIDRFILDPALSDVAREAFIVTDADFNVKTKKDFLEAAAAKHPDVVIIYVSRRGKSDVKPENGINMVLEKPNAEKLANAVFSIIESVTRKADVVSSSTIAQTEFQNTNIEMDEDVFTDAFGKPLEFDYTAAEEYKEPEPELEAGVEVPVDLGVVEEPVVQEEMPSVPEETLLERLSNCQHITDLKNFTDELKATGIIKDIIKTQADYTAIEERIKGLNEKINAVYDDPLIPMQEKLDKVHALLYDKGYYRAKTNTVIEQRIEELFSTIISKTMGYVNERCRELDKAISKYATYPFEQHQSTRVTALLNERSNVLLELAAMQTEMQCIYMGLEKVATEITDTIADQSNTDTGRPLQDSRQRLLGVATVPIETHEIIERILTKQYESAEDFEEAKRNIIELTKKLVHVLNMDKETFEAVTKTVELLKANNIEDTIIKETLIKKSLRVFVAQPGTGGTVIPYICSKVKSRESGNVLYIDITGNSKLQNYGEVTTDLAEWLDNPAEAQFKIVTGNLSNTPEMGQRLLVALTKAADYYRTINVVVRPEQNNIFDMIVPDVLCVNYIVDAASTDLEWYANFIKDTQYENVGQRVILNKAIPSVTSLVLDKLHLVTEYNVQCVSIPYEPVVVECAIRGIKPYEVEQVMLAFREVCKVC